jgi:hypothetical protein
MNWAHLILNYLQALVWPAFAMVVVVLFRNQIAKLVQNMTSIKAFGAQAEFKALEQQLENANLELDAIEITNAPSDALEAILNDFSIEEAETVANYDISDLNPDKPVKSAVEATSRMENILLGIFRRFGFPAVVDYLPAAGEILSEQTDLRYWADICEALTEMKDIALRLAETEPKVKEMHVSSLKEELNTTARRVTAGVYRISTTLVDYTWLSMLPADKRAELIKDRGLATMSESPVGLLPEPER